MDTLNGSIIGAEPALSAYRWNPLSSSPLSETDDDDVFCKQYKAKAQHYELNDDYTYSVTTSGVPESKPAISSSQTNSMPSIPLASCMTAAASLSSAFCKRPNAFTKPQPPAVLCERSVAQCDRSTAGASSFPADDISAASVLSNIKVEKTENNQNLYNSNQQNTFLSMSPNECSIADDVPFQNSTTPNSNNTTTNGTGTVTSSTNTNYNDSAQVDICRELILRQLMQDINTTCSKLGLPTNPYSWTAEHSGRWISDMCMQFQLSPPRQLFLSGRVLLSMTQEEFLDRAPEGGDTLHAQLQLWKTAFESYNQQNSTTNPGNPTQNSNNNWIQGNIRNVDRTTSAQDYLNNFNPNVVEVSPTFNYYTNANNTYQATNNDNRRSQQTFFPGVQGQAMDMLYSPSSSDASSTGSNDGRVTERPPENRAPTTQAQSPRHSGTVHLWHFIRELLDRPKEYSSCVRWVDREEGIFKIESSHHLARFWGQRKNRAQMNYDKLSRSLRQYYKKGIIKKPEKRQRLVYKFLPPYSF